MNVTAKQGILPVVSVALSMNIEESAHSSSSLRKLYDDYCTHGVVGPIDVISKSEADNVLKSFWNDANIFPTINPRSTMDERHHDQQQSHHQYNQKNDNLFKTHLFVPYINQLIRNPNLIRAVQTVLQTDDIRCWSCDFNIREWNAPTMIAPHQDATYAGLTPCEEVVTAWIALSDPVTIQEGGLIFYYGTHLLGQLPHTCDTIIHDDNNCIEINTEHVEKESSDRGNVKIADAQVGTSNSKPKLRNVLSRGQRCDIPNGVTGMSIPLRAGQATLHHFYTIHCSGPNLSHNDHNLHQPRVGLAIRYISAKVRKQRYIVKEMITYISGRTDIIHDDCFDEEWEPILPEKPTKQDIDRGKEVHAIAMERETTNYFTQSKS